MATNDIELVQSFCRKYINKVVRDHFQDVEGDNDSSLGRGTARAVIKRICLHKDNDPITLTLTRLLIWWVEARGLFDEYIFGIPSTDFDMSNTYLPQVKMHFSEEKYEASQNNRRPARSEVSFRWKEPNFSETSIRALAARIRNEFAKPPYTIKRGREFWSYADKSKGYYFQLKVQSEAEAQKVISDVIGFQEIESPDFEKYLREHKDKQNYSVQKTVRVMGELIKSPKKRPVATVKFAYAELFIPGTTKAIILVDRTGTKPGALIYA